jgi:hypothetical protein
MLLDELATPMITSFLRVSSVPPCPDLLSTSLAPIDLLGQNREFLSQVVTTSIYSTIIWTERQVSDL